MKTNLLFLIYQENFSATEEVAIEIGNSTGSILKGKPSNSE